jgi:hypothetical protein
MKDTRRARIWTLLAAVAFAAAVGVASKKTLARRDARVAAATAGADEGLKDAVAAPLPATVSVAGKPMPTSWFKTPGERRAEMDSALLAGRRRRALARRVSVQ